MTLGNHSWNRRLSLVATLAFFAVAGCQSSQPKSPYAALAHDPAPQTVAQTGATATSLQPSAGGPASVQISQHVMPAAYNP